MNNRKIDYIGLTKGTPEYAQAVRAQALGMTLIQYQVYLEFMEDWRKENPPLRILEPRVYGMIKNKEHYKRKKSKRNQN